MGGRNCSDAPVLSACLPAAAAQTPVKAFIQPDLRLKPFSCLRCSFSF